MDCNLRTKKSIKKQLCSALFHTKSVSNCLSFCTKSELAEETGGLCQDTLRNSTDLKENFKQKTSCSNVAWRWNNCWNCNLYIFEDETLNSYIFNPSTYALKHSFRCRILVNVNFTFIQSSVINWKALNTYTCSHTHTHTHTHTHSPAHISTQIPFMCNKLCKDDIQFLFLARRNVSCDRKQLDCNRLGDEAGISISFTQGKSAASADTRNRTVLSAWKTAQWNDCTSVVSRNRTMSKRRVIYTRRSQADPSWCDLSPIPLNARRFYCQYKMFRLKPNSIK